MIWPRTSRVALGSGIVLWLAAAALTPGEIAAAKRREPVRGRTAVVLVLYLVAALSVLHGMPQRD